MPDLTAAEFVLACDPGAMTGLAWLPLDGTKKLWAIERPLLPALELAEELLATHRNVHVVAERFRVDQDSLKKDTGEWWSLEGIGVLRYLCRKYQDRNVTGPYLQQSTSVKRTFTKRRLQHLGWRNPSTGDHMDDAARHLGHYLLSAGALRVADLGPAY